MTSAHHDPDRRFRLDVLATLVQEEPAAAGLEVTAGGDGYSPGSNGDR